MRLRGLPHQTELVPTPHGHWRDGPHDSLYGFLEPAVRPISHSTRRRPANGVPAQDIAARTASNVLLCADSTVELWLLDEQDGIAPVPRVPVHQASALIAEYKERLCRAKVKKEKIRWRQYALYEADPSGNAFRGWSTQPSATQADRTLKKLIREVVPIPAKGMKAAAEQFDVLRDRSRWLFRLLSLRVGKDREWGIASPLSRSDVSAFVKHAMLYPVPWGSGTSHLTVSEQADISERVLSRLEHYDFSTVDPLFVTKAVRASTLSPLRSAIDLFPTPQTFRLGHDGVHPPRRRNVRMRRNRRHRDFPYRGGPRGLERRQSWERRTARSQAGAAGRR